MGQGGAVTATERATPDEPFARESFRSPAGAVDIVVRWGDWVLSAHEISPLRTFVAGEQGCDITLPQEVLGAPRVPIVLARWDGDVRLIVPRSARVLLGGQTKRMSAARCLARGLGQASTTVPDAVEVKLLPGQTSVLFFKNVTIDVCRSEAAPKPPRKPLFDKRVALTQLGSFLVHAFVLVVVIFLQPLPTSNADEGMSDDQKYEFQERLNRAAEKEMEFDLEAIRNGYLRRARRNERRLQNILDDERDEDLRSGQMPRLGWTNDRAALAARDEAPRGTDQGLIGVLYDWPKPEATNRPQTPTRDVRTTPVTLPPDTQPNRSRFPSVRMGAVTLHGRLPPEVVQRIVRQNFGRFRLCYENGLRNNPNLQGRVSVRFVIGTDGAVSNVGNGGSDLPDGGVVSCIVRAFSSLSFPQPESGIVTVVYPVMLSPPD